MSIPLDIPSWMEGVAQFQENGFLKLLISDETGDDDVNNDDDTAEHHSEAKVLRSTETLLKMLNPPTTTTKTTPVVAKTQTPTEAAIEPSTKVPGDGGDCDDHAVANDENATTPTTSANVGDNTNSQPDDSSLNHLVRIRNLFDSIQAALADIQKMKQRDEVKKGERKKGGGRWNRDAGKLKSLEHRQNRLQEQLLSQQQQKEQESAEEEEEEEQRMEATGQQQASEEQESFEEEQELEHDFEKLNTEERQTPNEPLIRWVLTLNSIRALFPEILCILNHERRNDTKLKICSYKLSVASQGARTTQCWLIGQRVFDVTSQKACKKIHQEMRGILESFVRDPQVVQQVMTTKSFFEDDDKNNNFWTQQWLLWVSRETTIQPIPHPLHRLVEHSTLPAQTILEFAKQCDREYIIEPLALMGHQGSSEVQDRYVAAITTLHTTLSQLLTSRFRGARLSLYGSCMSNLSLGQSSDVDLSLYIPLAETTQRDFDEGRITPAKYEAQMKSLVFQVCRKLESTKNTFRDMQPIARARVPVVTGCFLHAGNPHSPDGSIK